MKAKKKKKKKKKKKATLISTFNETIWVWVLVSLKQI
jgi:hypothetical protein